MNKKEVTDELNRLKKFGYKVKTWNDKKPLRKAQSGWVDHVVFNKKYIVFIEVKIDKDVLSIDQKETAGLLSSISVHNKTMHYRTITEMKQVKALVDNLLTGKL